MKQLYVKDSGLKIIGTEERVPATAIVNGWSDLGDPIYAGQTELDWDGQHTITADEVMMVVDENGEPHLYTDCELRDDEDKENES
jgi:hypothetical protein